MKLSVVIPAYNEEKVIQNTLKKLDPEAEIIVVCNGCTDKTYRIAEGYATKIFNLKEKGVSLARNFGANHASNNRIVFLDADIKVGKNTLNKVMESKYNIGTTWVKANSDLIFDKLLMFFKNFLHPFYRSTGLIFCDKKIFNEVGGFDEGLSKKEDDKFVSQARKSGKYGVVNAFVYNDMRRFHKFGRLNLVYFWLMERFKPTKDPYPIIR